MNNKQYTNIGVYKRDTRSFEADLGFFAYADRTTTYEVEKAAKELLRHLASFYGLELKETFVTVNYKGKEWKLVGNAK